MKQVSFLQATENSPTDHIVALFLHSCIGIYSDSVFTKLKSVGSARKSTRSVVPKGEQINKTYTQHIMLNAPAALFWTITFLLGKQKGH